MCCNTAADRRAGGLCVERLARLAAAEHAFTEGGDVGHGIERVAVVGRQIAIEHQANPTLCQARVLPPQQRLAADEVALIEANPAMEADLEWGLAAFDVRPGQRERLLDAQALHGGHAIGAQAEVAPAGQEVFP